MTEDTASRRTSSLLIALPFLTIMFGAFVYAALGYIGYQEAQIPETWVKTDGQIVHKGIEVIENTLSDGSVEDLYQPRVHYRFEVDGTYIVGKQLSRHHLARTMRAVAETEIEDLKLGLVVPVHYNPENPEESVLRKSDTIGPMQAISSGLTIGMTTMAIFLITLLRRRRGFADNASE